MNGGGGGMGGGFVSALLSETVSSGSDRINSATLVGKAN
jgi:hypothetical protein